MTMDTTSLLIIIAIGSAVIIGVSVTGFVFFTRFLSREEERGQRFREIHIKPPDER